MKILLTGHKGFIGTRLAQKLDVIGIDLKDGKNVITADLPEVDVVIHMAAQSRVLPSIEDPVNDAINNVVATVRLAHHYSKTKFIYISSGGAIQKNETESPYGLSKYTGEMYVKMLCEYWTILRLPNIYGFGSCSVVDKFLLSKDVLEIYGDGHQTRDYVHVEDVTEAIKRSLEWPSGLYTLGSGKSVSVLDIAKATGKPFKHLPEIPGELRHSQVGNNTSWRPKIDVLNYIEERI